MELTKLTKKDFEKILRNYNIGKYKESQHITWALANTVYIVDTTKEKIVLKILEAADYYYVRYQIKLINFLKKRKIPVQKIIKTKDENFSLKYNGKRVILFKFVEGKNPKELSDELVRNIANKIGLMNKNLLKLKLDGKHTWRKDHEFKPLSSEGIKIKDFNFKKEENKLLKSLRKINKRKLRKSVVHGDCHSVNILVKGNKLKSIIDWDDAHEDYLIYEVSTFIVHSFIGKTKINKRQINIFLKEYQKQIKLNDEEKKALYFFIKQRLLTIIDWALDQMKKHPDLKKDLQKNMEKNIQKYKTFGEFSLNEFLKLF